MIKNLILIVLIMASGFSMGMENETEPTQEPGLAGGADNSANSYALLFMGNSHSSANGLPGLVKTLIETGVPGSEVVSMLAPGSGFLSDRLDDGVTQLSLISRDWTHVVLQAQKYSTSGLYFYPTDAAEEWIRRSKSQHALPILFPEWPRLGNTEEGPRVHQLHLDIAAREAACVAPVGLTWEESLARNGNLRLHAADGNHSNLRGALLTAYVFYQLITGRSAADLPHVQSIGVAAGIQQQLREVAAFVVEANRADCPVYAVSADTESLEFKVADDAVISSKTVTVTNSGAFDMSLQSISSTDTAFNLIGGTCLAVPLTLNAFDSCTVEVEFTPPADGYFTGTLQIDTSPASASITIILGGFRGPVIPALNSWGMLVMVLLLACSSLILIGTDHTQSD